MVASDLLLGFLLSKLFGKSQAPTASPSNVLPSGGGTRGTHARTPARSTQQASAPAATPAPTPFPANVDVPATVTKAPKGYKQAVEIWAIRPDVAAMQTNPVLTGAIGAVNDATAVHALELSFPAGWAPVQRVTAAEQQMAISLTKAPKWHDGGVIFQGPQTVSERRAFRMTKHPADEPAPANAPIPVPSQPGKTVPANVPVHAATPAAPPPGFDPISRAPASAPTLPASSSSQAIVTVQKGEGLATIAKRLGRPATAASAKELRAANIPNGPDGHTWVATSLTDPATNGIKRTDRKGGLQPGDRLFVPTSWGTL